MCIRDSNEFVPDATLDYLLESDGDVPTEREKELASLDEMCIRDRGYSSPMMSMAASHDETTLWLMLSPP